ncbi:c-type cytochrome [Erwinia sp. SLM-02]|uniref:c-type cytochrome n=1 Tax=Erwinia sp. SLM-02 TaxID=3020057 RepID=UPI0030807F6B
MKHSRYASQHHKKHSTAWRLCRWTSGIVACVVVVAVLAWLATLVIPKSGNALAKDPLPVNEQQIKRGEYLARVGDCVACHTAPGKPAFSGGLPIASPIGGMIPPNITPDKSTGIGHYSYGDFERAVRYGIAPSGDTLYPAMPWISYSRLTQDDMAALYAYFMHGVTPVVAPRQQNTIPWPLSLRWPMTWWRWLFAPETALTAALPKDPVALGTYYVTGLGHCGACHTPRAITLQEAVFDNSKGSQYLSGGQVIDGYSVPSLRGERRSGLGLTRAEEIVALLKTGRSDKTATFGPMSDVVTHSTQYMSDSDLYAIAAYLRSLQPNIIQDKPYYDLTTLNRLTRGDELTPGGKLYLSHCEGCHLANGLGYKNKLPALALNTMVNNPDPASLIKIVLTGATNAETKHSDTLYSMPAYAGSLSDENIADVLSFIRSSWGNQAAEVSASAVSEVRKDRATRNNNGARD